MGLRNQRNSRYVTKIKKPTFYVSFDLNKQVRSLLCKTINQQVVFLPVFNKEQGYPCVHACMVGKLVGKKSAKQSNLGAVSLQNISTVLNKTSVV